MTLGQTGDKYEHQDSRGPALGWTGCYVAFLSFTGTSWVCGCRRGPTPGHSDSQSGVGRGYSSSGHSHAQLGWQSLQKGQKPNQLPFGCSKVVLVKDKRVELCHFKKSMYMVIVFNLQWFSLMQSNAPPITCNLSGGILYTAGSCWRWCEKNKKGFV